MPSLRKYGAVPVSGNFLRRETVMGVPVYPDQMATIFDISDAALGGVPAACLTAKDDDSQWQCNFAQHAYANTKSMTFPLNSALDSWQTVCIYTSELPDAFPKQTGN